MAERKISEKSLENLKRSNQESNAITRESLEISLLQLLDKKDLKKITISELVERAGVSRAAFYRNYESKEELLESIFQSTVSKITKSLEGYNFKTDLYQIWVYLFKEAKKEARIISLAVDYNFEKLLTKAVYEFLEKRSKTQKNSQGPASYLNSFLSSAIVSVLAKWIKDGMKVPAEKMASLGLPLFPQKKRK
ncbi:TetR family transcriptional regulator [Streptococcus ilei]|uniref:TetR/AcrR family transcriptional regulator n=1 Tax=Streptococcus ilei TaxID=1156431 RepID=UPI0003B932EF|nr:TetR/AcrR family transcriptional regulator [Streptococcus ilei]AGY38462.1 TetR family transcriptional regulator [Streptococcus ilei]